MKFLTKHSIIVAAALTLTACSQPTGTRFAAPDPGPLTTVRLGDGGMTELAANFRSLGFSVSSSDSGFTATKSSSDYVDCGVVRQNILGNSSAFSGAAPFGVVYSDPETLRLFSRSVSVMASVNVVGDGRVATLNENHSVAVSWESGNGKSLGTQTESVTPGRLAAFADGSSCATNGKLAAAL